MGRLLKGLATLDPGIAIALLALAALSTANLVVIGDPGQAVRQLQAVALGLVLMGLLVRTSLNWLPRIARFTYLMGVLMLLAVDAAGHSAFGARRWLMVGPLVVQPSEVAKLGLLLVLCDVLGMTGLSGQRRALLALGLAGLPVALTLRQPDLSTASLLILVTAGALAISPIGKRALLTAVAVCAPGVALAAVLGSKLLRPYQAERLRAFWASVGSHHDLLGSGWQAAQARVAVASGHLFGMWRDPLHRLWAEYLPARETDLAFASTIEQLGLVAGALAFGAVILLIARLVVLARQAREASAGLVAGSLAILFGSEAVVNVAGNLGALPIAGVPFPLLSYGGTAAVAHLSAVGLAMSIRRDRKRRRLWSLAGPARRPRLLRASALALTAAQAALVLLAWQIQTVYGSQLVALGRSEIQRCFRLPAPRGMILDRHGTPLVANSTGFVVDVVPGILLQTPGVEAKLAALLGQPEAGLHRQLEANHSTIDLRLGEVSSDQAARIRLARLPGVLVTQSAGRSYPYGPALAPILGFTGVASPADMRARPELPMGAIVGKSGLEAEYDTALRGRDGSQCVYVDPAGNPVAMGGGYPPTPGRDLLTTLDLGLQQAAFRRIEQALGSSPADRAALVVMDPSSGQILAMASAPAYDDNLFNGKIDQKSLDALMRGRGSPFLNHAIQLESPPGSTFKLVVGSADVVYGAIPPEEVIPTGYTFSYGSWSYTNWRPLPPQNLHQAIAWSNDVYFYKLAVTLGPEKIATVARQLGVGRQTGVDLPGERPGFLGTPETVSRLGETWYSGSTVILGIGQGYITATPLQVARWTGAVVTGQVATPHLGLGLSSPGGQWELIRFPSGTPLPFADQLGPVRQGMREAVLSGTGDLLRGIPIEAGGKTGTAEDPSAPSGQPDGWFTSAAPMSDPQVVITMEARGSGEGYNVTEPAVADVMRYYVDHRAHLTGFIQPEPARELREAGAGSDR